MLTRPTRKPPRLRARDKLVWVVARALRRDWRWHLILVRPESVIRWHRQAWRLFWRWRSHGPLGRPRLSAEVRGLIATMAHDNPRWGSERIRGELLQLGVVVSKRSIQTFKTLYVLVFIAHRRRELVHVNVTSSPSAAWVWRQVIEATPWGRKPRHLLRDHDAVYGRDFRQPARRIGIDAIATPIASPRANAVIEDSSGRYAENVWTI